MFQEFFCMGPTKEAGSIRWYGLKTEAEALRAADTLNQKRICTKVDVYGVEPPTKLIPRGIETFIRRVQVAG